MFDKFPYIDEDVGDTNDYNSNDDVFDVEKQERETEYYPHSDI